MDIPQLVKLLNEHQVKYVLIGATAFPVHGYARATLDVDFFIEPTLPNAQRAIAALKTFGYDMSDLTAEELLETKALIRGYVVEADIHPFVAGIQSFAEVWETRVSGDIEGVPTQFANLDTLIRMKEAAGRPKDLEDLKILRELKTKK